MSEEREERLSTELLRLLGEDAYLRLAEAYGGIRLFVPQAGDTQLAEAIGTAAARVLTSRYGRSYLRVPLARAARARQYRSHGMSNAQIARKLGIAESSVDKLFARMPDKPKKGSADPRQLKLFG